MPELPQQNNVELGRQSGSTPQGRPRVVPTRVGTAILTGRLHAGPGTLVQRIRPRLLEFLMRAPTRTTRKAVINRFAVLHFAGVRSVANMAGLREPSSRESCERVSSRDGYPFNGMRVS